MSNLKNLPTSPRSLAGPSSALGRFADRLLQTFEDRRPGLSDEALKSGEAAVQQYFMEVYDGEAARLEETVNDQPLLTDHAKEKLRSEVDGLIRKVIIPAYARQALKHTPKERNDFYLTAEHLHGLERVGWGLAGLLVGVFVIVAPFIPLWSKEWIIPFMVAGLLFPNIRRYLTLQRYEKDLNRLVAQADREFARIDVAYLTSGEDLDGLSAPQPVAALEPQAEEVEEPGEQEDEEQEQDGDDEEERARRRAHARQRQKE